MCEVSDIRRWLPDKHRFQSSSETFKVRLTYVGYHATVRNLVKDQIKIEAETCSMGTVGIHVLLVQRHCSPRGNVLALHNLFSVWTVSITRTFASSFNLGLRWLCRGGKPSGKLCSLRLICWARPSGHEELVRVIRNSSFGGGFDSSATLCVVHSILRRYYC